MASSNVFVYGSLKRGFVNHRVLARARFLGAGVTAPCFAMVDLGPYPGVVPGNFVVTGEVYSVAPTTLASLDRLEANGRVYQRRIVPITLSRGPVEAWIYVFLSVRHRRQRVAPRCGTVTWRER
jgi:gamma-glutamylaminecyclotransferase